MMAAYWVVRVNVLDAKKLQAYAPLAAAAVEAHGGRYLARGGAHETTEGMTMRKMSWSAGRIWPQRRLPITALNIKRQEIFWVMARTVYL